jgi:hypothetical protein
MGSDGNVMAMGKSRGDSVAIHAGAEAEVPFRKTQREGLMRCRPNRPLQTPAQDVKGHVTEAVTRSFFLNGGYGCSVGVIDSLADASGWSASV